VEQAKIFHVTQRSDGDHFKIKKQRHKMIADSLGKRIHEGTCPVFVEQVFDRPRAQGKNKPQPKDHTNKMLRQSKRSKIHSFQNQFLFQESIAFAIHKIRQMTSVNQTPKKSGKCSLFYRSLKRWKNDHIHHLVFTKIKKMNTKGW